MDPMQIVCDTYSKDTHKKEPPITETANSEMSFP